MIVTVAQTYTAMALLINEISVVLMLRNIVTWKLIIQRNVLMNVARKGIFRQSENKKEKSRFYEIFMND